MYIYTKDKWVYLHRWIIARFGIRLGRAGCCPTGQMDKRLQVSGGGGGGCGEVTSRGRPTTGKVIYL